MARTANDRRAEVIAAITPGQWITHNDLVAKLEKEGKSDCVQEIYGLWTEKLIKPKLEAPPGQTAPVLSYTKES